MAISAKSKPILFHTLIAGLRILKPPSARIRMNLIAPYTILNITGKPIGTLKSEPYAVAVYEIGRTWLEIAKREVEPLEALYADCLNSGDWYGYNQSIIISNPPAWAAKK